MPRLLNVMVLSASIVAVFLSAMNLVSAQQPGSATTKPGAATPTKSAATPAVVETAAPEAPKPVVVQRQVMKLLPRERYQVPLQLRAARMIALASPVDGTVREVRHKSGDKAESQGEIIRLESIEQQLLVERAKANFRAAQIEQKRAQTAGGDKDLMDLAEARVQAAKADLDLASYRLDQASIRAPFNSEIFRIHVTPGQVVRAGETLAIVGDTSSLIAELPVDRKTAAAGQSLKFHVESVEVEGKVESILPLEPRFEPLRELVDSAATGVVLLDNASGKLHAGQTAYSTLIPRDPVSEVPNGAVANLAGGGRKVQVVRGNVIRDIPVALMGGVGPTRSFVSGTFSEGDEVIVSISQELPDGTLLRSHSDVASGTGPATGASSTAQPPRSKTSAGKSGDSAPKKTGF